MAISLIAEAGNLVLAENPAQFGGCPFHDNRTSDERTVRAMLIALACPKKS